MHAVLGGRMSESRSWKSVSGQRCRRHACTLRKCSTRRSLNYGENLISTLSSRPQCLLGLLFHHQDRWFPLTRSQASAPLHPLSLRSRLQLNLQILLSPEPLQIRFCSPFLESLTGIPAIACNVRRLESPPRQCFENWVVTH